METARSFDSKPRKLSRQGGVKLRGPPRVLLFFVILAVFRCSAEPETSSDKESGCKTSKDCESGYLCSSYNKCVPIDYDYDVEVWSPNNYFDVPAYYHEDTFSLPLDGTPFCSNNCNKDGQKVCEGNAWKKCADYNEDGCLEWSELYNCLNTEYCGDGVCHPEELPDTVSYPDTSVSPDSYVYPETYVFPDSFTKICTPGKIEKLSSCWNGATKEFKKCSSDGQEWNYGTDDCWHSDCEGSVCMPTKGDTPDTCLINEDCVSCDDPQCSYEGEKFCMNDQPYQCLVNLKGCLKFGWTTMDKCSDLGKICKDGECVEDCEDECAATKDKTCSGNSYLECKANLDADTCLDYKYTSCGTDTCTPGKGCEPSCEDGCVGEGFWFCYADNKSYKACGNFDDDTCLEFGDVSCDSGEICNNADLGCVASCTDECEEFGWYCKDNKVMFCDYYDTDPCLEEKVGEICGLNEICMPDWGCEENCTNDCKVTEDKTCSGSNYIECYNKDADSCLEKTVTACAAGTTCTTGIGCVANCMSECAPNEDKTCSGKNYLECYNQDTDSCLELKFTTCAAGTTCTTGKGCVAPTCTPSNCKETEYPCEDGTCKSYYYCVNNACVCGDKCSEGDKFCEAMNTIAGTCADYNDDGCIDVKRVNCNCKDGACVSTCTSECTAAENKTCSGNSYIQCYNKDTDTCLEKTVEACGAKTCMPGVGCVISQVCTPSEISDKKYCLDGSIKEYKICKLDGSGWNPVSQPCYHKECVNGTCTLTNGDAQNTCSVDSECQTCDEFTNCLSDEPYGCGEGICTSAYKCAGNVCQCLDKCDDGFLYCEDGDVALICTDVNGDGCVDAKRITCPDFGKTCKDGACIVEGCVSNCTGKTCGSDGCGGSCGTCSSPPADKCLDSYTLRDYTGLGSCSGGQCNYSYNDFTCQNGCENGKCKGCTPKTCSQLGKECGSWNDGCGGTVSCPSCSSGKTCDVTGKCICNIVSSDKFDPNEEDDCSGGICCWKCVSPFCKWVTIPACSYSCGDACAVAFIAHGDNDLDGTWDIAESAEISAGDKEDIYELEITDNIWGTLEIEILVESVTQDNDVSVCAKWAPGNSYAFGSAVLSSAKAFSDADCTEDGGTVSGSWCCMNASKMSGSKYIMFDNVEYSNGAGVLAVKLSYVGTLCEKVLYTLKIDY